MKQTKKTTPKAETKITLKKGTLKDLSAGAKAWDVRGGKLVLAASARC